MEDHGNDLEKSEAVIGLSTGQTTTNMHGLYLKLHTISISMFRVSLYLMWMN